MTTAESNNLLVVLTTYAKSEREVLSTVSGPAFLHHSAVASEGKRM